MLADLLCNLLQLVTRDQHSTMPSTFVFADILSEADKVVRDRELELEKAGFREEEEEEEDEKELEDGEVQDARAPTCAAGPAAGPVSSRRQVCSKIWCRLCVTPFDTHWLKHV